MMQSKEALIRPRMDIEEWHDAIEEDGASSNTPCSGYLQEAPIQPRMDIEECHNAIEEDGAIIQHTM